MHYQPIEVILSEANLKVRQKMWQDILELSDWDIRVRLANMGELHKPQDEPWGTCIAENYLKRVEILIVREEQFKGLPPFDMELALVHELLHLIVPNIDNERVEETCVWSLAKSLVGLMRYNSIVDEGR